MFRIDAGVTGRYCDGLSRRSFVKIGVAGIDRLAWDLHPTKDLLTEYGGQGAERFIPPGEYTVTLTVGTLKETQKLQVSIPPGVETR